MGAVSTRLNTFYIFSDLTDDHQAKHEYSCNPRGGYGKSAAVVQAAHS